MKYAEYKKYYREKYRRSKGVPEDMLGAPYEELVEKGFLQKRSEYYIDGKSLYKIAKELGIYYNRLRRLYRKSGEEGVKKLIESQKNILTSDSEDDTKEAVK